VGEKAQGSDKGRATRTVRGHQAVIVDKDDSPSDGVSLGSRPFSESLFKARGPWYGAGVRWGEVAAVGTRACAAALYKASGLPGGRGRERER
jgi:hypothetical protein